MEIKYLVFDLDECLLSTERDAFSSTMLEHSIYQSQKFNLRRRLLDIKISLEGMTVHMLGLLRPHLREFLEFCQENYIVSVWSAGHPSYVHKCVDVIFQGLKYPHLVMTRNEVENIPNSDDYHKPLRKFYQLVPGANPSNTILIDDRVENFRENPANGILISKYIPNWQVEDTDTELLKLWKWLKTQPHERSPQILSSECERIEYEKSYDPRKRYPVRVNKNRVEIVVM